MKKKCLAQHDCPLARGYNVIGDWWSLLIVMQILTLKTHRFSELEAGLGMAKNILTARLRKLVAEGILEKRPAADGSAYHEYVPTERGRDLYTVLVALRQWGERHYAAGCRTETHLVDKSTGQPLPPLEVRSADGRSIGPEDLEIVATGATNPML